jgi:hypothetical protein
LKYAVEMDSGSMINTYIPRFMKIGAQGVEGYTYSDTHTHTHSHTHTHTHLHTQTEGNFISLHLFL